MMPGPPGAGGPLVAQVLTERFAWPTYLNGGLRRDRWVVPVGVFPSVRFR